MQILKFKCRIKKEVKFKITPHNANSQNFIYKIRYISKEFFYIELNPFHSLLKQFSS